MIQDLEESPCSVLEKLREDPGWRGDLVRMHYDKCLGLGFNPDEKSQTFTLPDDMKYSELDSVRAIVYALFPTDTSLSFGNLPPMLSRFWWQVAEAWPREDINSFKYQGKKLAKTQYHRYQAMQVYQPQLHKVQLVNLSRTQQTLTKGFAQAPSLSDLDEEFNLRIQALDWFIQEIEQGKWPHLVLIAHAELPELIGYKSYTATPHVSMEVTRKEGGQSHLGVFTYSRDGGAHTHELYNNSWKLAIEAGKALPAWPDIVLPEAIIHNERVLRNCNIYSVKAVMETMTKAYCNVRFRELHHCELPHIFSKEERESNKTTYDFIQKWFTKRWEKEYLKKEVTIVVNIENINNFGVLVVENSGQVYTTPVPDYIAELRKMKESSLKEGGEFSNESKELLNCILEELEKAENDSDQDIVNRSIELLKTGGREMYTIAKDAGTQFCAEILKQFLN